MNVSEGDPDPHSRHVSGCGVSGPEGQDESPEGTHGVCDGDDLFWSLEDRPGDFLASKGAVRVRVAGLDLLEWEKVNTLGSVL